jgi:hypothetical protein
MSHAIASSTPCPTHQPLIAATMGFLMRDSGPRVIPHRPSSRRSRPTISPTVCHSGALVFRSAPAVNASPVPVMTATRSAGSSRKSRQMWHSSSWVSTSIAFLTSGRLSVMTATSPRFS